MPNVPRRTGCISSVLTVMLCLVAGRVESQTPPPPSSVFRGAEVRDTQPGGLGLMFDLFHAYDDNVLAEQGGGVASRPRAGASADGMYSGLGVAMMFQRPAGETDFRAWANSAFRYYPDLEGMTATTHYAGASMSRSLGRRFSLQISPFAGFSPHYSMRLFPRSDRDLSEPDDQIIEPPNVDEAVVDGDTFRYGGHGSVNLALSTVTALTASYGYAHTDVGDRAPDMEVHSAGVNFSHRFTRASTFRMGYTRQVGTRQLDDSPIQSINIGVDYRKPLSRSRRTSLRFSSGSAVAEDAGARRLQILGSASLVHQMGRTWTAQTEYRRSFRYIEGFYRPVLSDSVTASVNGLASRRLEFLASTSYFVGSADPSGEARPFDSYSARARLRTAVSRTLAAYIEYLFYHYQFADGIARPPDLPQSFDRHGVRIGLSLYVPVLGGPS